MVTAISPISTVQDISHMMLREQHCEVALLPRLLKITKTDFGLALGLPPTFWDGSYDKEGEQKMIRLQDVIHHGAWKKQLLRPSPHTLPSGFTLIHFALTTVAIDFTRFFLKYYSKRYQKLPKEPEKSRWVLYNGARACALWESFEEKMLLQEQGIRAFACPWVYERLVQGRQLFRDYPQGKRIINGQAKAYRTSHGKFGIRPEVAVARHAALYNHMNEEIEKLAALPPPEPLPPLPSSVPEFLLLEEPPIEVFA